MIPVGSAEQLRAWVKWQLNERGLTFADVARKAGANRNAAQKAFLQPYPKMERAIAEAIDRSPEELWPDRWRARSERYQALVHGYQDTTIKHREGGRNTERKSPRKRSVSRKHGGRR